MGVTTAAVSRRRGGRLDAVLWRRVVLKDMSEVQEFLVLDAIRERRSVPGERRSQSVIEHRVIVDGFMWRVVFVRPRTQKGDRPTSPGRVRAVLTKLPVPDGYMLLTGYGFRPKETERCNECDQPVIAPDRVWLATNGTHICTGCADRHRPAMFT